MLPKLLIFDMDGLLFDTERMFMNLRAEILPKYGYVHREEDYMKTVGVSGTILHQILEEIYGKDYPADIISKETREVQLQYIEAHGVPVKPGIKPLLQWLEEKEIPCCVATSTHRPAAQKILKASGLLPFFSFLVTGEEVALTKPDPEIFLKACQIAKTEPSCALVLEDSENGVRAALRGGIPVICIPDMKKPGEEIARKASAVLESAEQVPGWIETCFG